MANVKARSLTITSLCLISICPHGSRECRIRAHVETAGAMLDFSLAAGLLPILSSFSRMDFS